MCVGGGGEGYERNCQMTVDEKGRKGAQRALGPEPGWLTVGGMLPDTFAPWQDEIKVNQGNRLN